MGNLSNWNDGASMKTGISADNIAGNFLSAGASLGGGVTVMSQSFFANPGSPDVLKAYDPNGPVNYQDLGNRNTSLAIGTNVLNTYGAVSGAFELKAAISAVRGAAAAE